MNVRDLIPEHIQSLTPYKAGKTIREVQEEYQPREISKLASNENRLGCSDLVKTAVLKAFESTNDYPDPIARTLRKEISQSHSVDEEEVLIAAGSESIISILCRTLFNPGEHIITADATFVGLFVQAGAQGIEVEKVPHTKSFSFDVDGLLNGINSHTKAVYIANPNNPTGTYITQNQYQKLLDNLPENVFLIMDEAYAEYAEDVEDFPQAIVNRKKNIIVLRTFSKAYGLAGFRVGYAIADKDIVEQLLKVKLTFEPTTLGQYAALAALKDQDFIKKSVRTVKEGRKKLYYFFDEHHMNYVKSISNSVLLILKSSEEAKRITNDLLKQGVIVRQTGAFGLPQCIRITIGTPKEMVHFEEIFRTCM